MTGSLSTPVNQADVAGRISSYFGVASGDSRIAKLLEAVLPDVERASAHNPKGSWQSEFPGLMAKYESLARDLGLGVSQRQRDIDALRHANHTDANFAGALGRLGLDGLRHYAILSGNGGADGGRSGGTSAGGERHSSMALNRELPLSATGAIGFAKELGIRPGEAGFFVGASHEMRDALRDAIQNGKAITDDQVKNPRDVSAVIGAIRAGKLKPDDPRIPPSVRQIIEDMKKKGIDTNDSKAVGKYLKEHPEALNGAKAAVKKDSEAAKAAGLTSQKMDDVFKKVAEEPTAAARATPTAKGTGSTTAPAAKSDDKAKPRGTTPAPVQRTI
jgi:hypothetical protein